MTIQVKLFGQLRTIIGTETVAIECDSEVSSKLGVVLDEIAQQHADVRDYLLKPDGTIAGGLLVSIEDVVAVPDRDLPLSANSTITLLTAISGG
jgi:molybdopterin converting factor small subunit